MITLIKKLKEKGITYYQVNRFRLYNPDTYDKMIIQARHSIDIAVKDYKRIIQASNKRR